jgi:hypothetical protein
MLTAEIEQAQAFRLFVRSHSHRNFFLLNELNHDSLCHVMDFLSHEVADQTAVFLCNII